MTRRSALPTALAGILAASAAAAVVTLLPTSAGATTARQRLDTLVHQRSASSTSISVVDVRNAHALTVGSASGMVTASVAKLELLETLLAIRQSQHRNPTKAEQSHLVPMIEHSSNTDADWVFRDIGGRSVVRLWENPLGLLKRLTDIGRGGHWGLTTTSAAQQIVLLRNLVEKDSPLHAAGRAYALHLMRRVESDQRWGVPSVATSGSPANKNGWVNIVSDHDYWAVNSVGVVTVDHRLLLIAVMTQHDHGFPAGVRRVEQLARAAVAAEQAA